MLDDGLFDGKYRIIKVLGSGGMGTVYLAENVKLGTYWAIKEINRVGNERKDILAEANILKKVSHPALPRIFDIVERDDFIYVISDYIDGMPLDRELERVGSFSENTVIKWAKQICDVLSYLHSFKPNPIIYRDMKPSNIILTKDGTIRLIDFGTAREYKSGSENDTVYIGTKGYAAPEQYGIGQTNVTTDIYSLGVTLYSLLTGKKPNEPPYELKPVRYFDCKLSKGIEEIIGRCTRQDPLERYPSVQELRQDMERLGDRTTVEGATEREDCMITGKDDTKCTYYKKLVLSVWGNAEFACELAYMVSRMTGFRVLLANLDFISCRPAMYLDLESMMEELFGKKPASFGFKKISDALHKNRLNLEVFENSCIRNSKTENMYFLIEPYSIDNYELFKDMDKTLFIESAYDNFDLTVLILNRSVYDLFAVECMRKSDFNITAAHANMDELREFEAHVHYMYGRNGIPESKMKFVAYEYKKNINISLNYLKSHILGESYIGHVSYSIERETCRNISSFYAKHAFAKNAGEYEDILSKLNIMPGRPNRRRVNGWFKSYPA